MYRVFSLDGRDVPRRHDIPEAREGLLADFTDEETGSVRFDNSLERAQVAGPELRPAPPLAGSRCDSDSRALAPFVGGSFLLVAPPVQGTHQPPLSPGVSPVVPPASRTGHLVDAP